MGCYTAYIVSKSETVAKFTRRRFADAEQAAKKYIEDEKLKDVVVFVEDNFDKYYEGDQ